MKFYIFFKHISFGRQMYCYCDCILCCVWLYQIKREYINDNKSFREGGDNELEFPNNLLMIIGSNHIIAVNFQTITFCVHVCEWWMNGVCVCVCYHRLDSMMCDQLKIRQQLLVYSHQMLFYCFEMVYNRSQSFGIYFVCIHHLWQTVFSTAVAASFSQLNRF